MSELELFKFFWYDSTNIKLVMITVFDICLNNNHIGNHVNNSRSNVNTNSTAINCSD